MSKSIATMARHPARAAVVLALALAALLVGIMNVSAVHDISVFELEGDALDDVPAAVAGDDWDTVLLGGGGSADTFVFVEASTEAPAVDSSAFHKGGSKDDNDVSLGGATPHVWAFRESGPGPDKDDITNAYAASYAVGPDTIVYFGLDLFANNGNAFAGFWFFQEEIGLNADGTFSGHHTDGDRLVLSDFTNGGNVSTIRVFEWKAGGGDVGANLLEVTPPGVLDFNCDTIIGAHIACASVNAPGDADAPPWDYAPKGGSEGDDFPLGSFYEGGLNLGPDAPCFSSFLAETRASQSVTAKLWDFALGDFDTCGSLTIVKDAIPPDGTDFDYDGTGTGIDTDFDLDDSADSDTGADLEDSITFPDLAPNGPRTVTENITAGWALTDISCELDGGGVPNSTIIFTGATTSPTDDFEAGDDTVEVTSLTALEDIVCTFTNEQAMLTVQKILVPSDDDGLFDLRIDGNVELADASHLDSVTKVVSIGSHTVDETAGTDTSLADYFTPVIGGDCASDGSITLVGGDDKTCTITNTRIPTLTVNKILIPSSDPGLFNLQIDGSTAGTGANVGDGGTTGAVDVSIGGHTVGETAGTDTTLADYFTPVISGDCAADGSVTVAAGDNKTCTITNTRRPDVEVDKDGLISYTIDATNNGPGTATDVDIDDDLPGDLNWAENPNLAECSIIANHLHCDIATLADGATFSVTVEADIVDTSCTSDLLSNTADVAADNESPNDLGNNSDTAVICAP